MCSIFIAFSFSCALRIMGMKIFFWCMVMRVFWLETAVLCNEERYLESVKRHDVVNPPYADAYQLIQEAIRRGHFDHIIAEMHQGNMNVEQVIAQILSSNPLSGGLGGQSSPLHALRLQSILRGNGALGLGSGLGLEGGLGIGQGFGTSSASGRLRNAGRGLTSGNMGSGLGSSTSGNFGEIIRDGARFFTVGSRLFLNTGRIATSVFDKLLGSVSDLTNGLTGDAGGGGIGANLGGLGVGLQAGLGNSRGPHGGIINLIHIVNPKHPADGSGHHTIEHRHNGYPSVSTFLRPRHQLWSPTTFQHPFEHPEETHASNPHHHDNDIQYEGSKINSIEIPPFKPIPD